MSHELENIDSYLRAEIDDLELAPSDNVWYKVTHKLETNMAARQSRKMKGKLIVGAAALVAITAVVVNYVDTTIAAKPAASKEQQVSQKTAPAVVQTTPQQVLAANEKANTQNASVEHQYAVSHKLTSAKEIVHDNLNDNVIVIDPVVNVPKQENKPADLQLNNPSQEVKKASTDKEIIMLPYFPAHYDENSAQANKQATVNNTTAKPEVPEIKVENREKIIYVPNAFTPNGDGLNDIFLPQAAEALKEYKFSVFDRQGHMVFFSDDVQKGWDGHMVVNGADDIKEDVYIWRIELKNAKGEREHLMGTLTLLK